MLSPFLGFYKSAESTEGHQEIYDCWTEAFKNPNGVDHTALADAITGGLQFAYNNRETHLTKV
jgi:hypothetical protein